MLAAENAHGLIDNLKLAITRNIINWHHFRNYCKVFGKFRKKINHLGFVGYIGMLVNINIDLIQHEYCVQFQ